MDTKDPDGTADRNARRRASVQLSFVRQWERFGTLWNWNQALRLEDQIFEECGVVRSEPPMSPDELRCSAPVYELPFGTEPLGEEQRIRNGKSWASFTEEEKAERRREIDETVYYRSLPGPEQEQRNRKDRDQALLRAAQEKSRALKEKAEKRARIRAAATRTRESAKALAKVRTEAAKPKSAPLVYVHVDVEALRRWKQWTGGDVSALGGVVPETKDVS